MSDKRSNFGTAGMVVAGGALLGAACYAAYEMFKDSSFLNSEQPPTVPHNSSVPRTRGSVENRRCPICERGYSEDPFQLPCRHHFHKICIQANRILHMDEDQFKCPVCRTTVPPDFLKELD